MLLLWAMKTERGRFGAKVSQLRCKTGFSTFAQMFAFEIYDADLLFYSLLFVSYSIFRLFTRSFTCFFVSQRIYIHFPLHLLRSRPKSADQTYLDSLLWCLQAIWVKLICCDTLYESNEPAFTWSSVLLPILTGGGRAASSAWKEYVHVIEGAFLLF
jgi:hypothetical protein